MTLDELTALRDDLKRAIYSGVFEIRFGERMIRYQTRGEMRQALADLNSEIENFNSSEKRSMSNFVRFNG